MDIRTRIAGVPTGLAIVALLLMSMASAQKTKEFAYTVGPKAVVAITNNYGPITIKPSGSRQVVVRASSYSDATTFENEQYGNRIELRSHSLKPGTGLAEYTVLVPGDSRVMLQSSAGTLHAEGLNGDVVLEAGTASVEVSDIMHAHLHVKTLSGPITLTAIRNSHLDIRSVSGNITLHNVTESSVEVNSGRGRITYQGDPGPTGEYLLASYSGDLEVSIPAGASVEIKADSLEGESDKDFPESGGAGAIEKGNPLLKPGMVSKSRFVLRSFKGKIRLKRP
jgi:DUF4097 and DUF4098 domain-containing protein YvlB